MKNSNVNNYLIEIGGELSARGLNNDNKFWRVGIEKPIDSSYTGEYGFQKIIELKNKSLATSGNYRKYRIINGKRISHSINPKTGYPANNSLLSISVICDKAAKADALATSFMIMGKKKLDYI